MITIAIAGVATAMTTAIIDNGRRNAGPHCFRLQHTADRSNHSTPPTTNTISLPCFAPRGR